MTKGIQVEVRSNSGKTRVMHLFFAPYKSEPGTYRILDENNRHRGIARKVGSQFEVGFSPIGSAQKKFTHRTRKQALMMAIDHWNSTKEGRVCSICQESFPEPLKLYKGIRACPDHANPNFILSLGGPI